MITLSYSTINMLYTASHNWINKQCGIKAEEKSYFNEGKIVHRIIQDHVSGKKKDDRLEHITFTFPIVEQKDFDENCRSWRQIDADYAIHGFIDGRNDATKQMLEIKSSSTLWSAGKFKSSMQRKVYAYLFPEYKEAILITCPRTPETWTRDNIKTVVAPQTDEDRKEAIEWIKGGINIVKNGEFSGGLNESGKCTDRFCFWGNKCMFK